MQLSPEHSVAAWRNDIFVISEGQTERGIAGGNSNDMNSFMRGRETILGSSQAYLSTDTESEKKETKSVGKQSESSAGSSSK